MKKFITKFWGVGLIIVLLSSLFVVAAPVSAAQALRWEPKLDTPISLFNVLAPGSTIMDYAVNGATMYAVTGAVPAVPPAPAALYQSAMGGAMWTDISARLNPAIILTADYVAIAPDNPSIIAVATRTPTVGTGIGVQISVNAGLTFTSMGVVQDATFTDRIATIDGIAISQPIAGGFRYIAVYGIDTAAQAAVFYYNYGAGVGSWKDAMIDFAPLNPKPVPFAITPFGTLDETVAFSFSPTFQGDYMAVAVLYDATNGVLELHELSFNAGGNWDTEPGYPAAVFIDPGAAAFTVINKVSLVLNPGYDGSDETSRIAFIGIDLLDSSGATPVGGVWRAFDSSVGQIFGAVVASPIWSVAYDGTNVAAGSSVTNNVFRSVNPLASAPTFLSARNLKRIGTLDGADQVIVKYVDGTLYGGKNGTGSALSKSADYGNTWNDFALINDDYQAVGTIDDIYVTAAGDPWYMSTNDLVTTNVYRIAGFSVTRVLCVPTGVNFILRGLDSSADVIYAADTTGGLDIYYSADGGLSRWFKRTAPAALADLAVDSASTIFVGDAASPDIYKSINSGFTWSSAETSNLFATVCSLYALGDGKVVAGGLFGDVSYTTNGGDAWALTVGTWGTKALVSASGLAAGDYLFAADTASANVYRCILGPTNPMGEWQSMNAPTTLLETNTGLVYKNGVLYTLADDSTTVPPCSYINRTTLPTVPGTHFGFFWSTTYADPARAFPIVDALAATVANNVFTIYAIDATVPLGVYYFQDTLALASPILTGPADGALIQLTSALLGSSQNVNFTWNRISLATAYNLYIALDNTFLQPIGLPIATISGAPIVSSIVPGGNFNPGNTYYWRVQATAPLTSGFSETRSFTVQPSAASVPNISSPIIGAAIDNVNPGFSWSPVSGTTMYSFELAKDSNFTDMVYTANTTGAGSSVPAAMKLTRGQQYFWRVKSLQPVESDWSTVANFVVAMPVVTPTPIILPTQTPAPIPTIILPTPTVTVNMPTEAAKEVINPTYIWAIIIIGAVLVIAVIVLIVRTRRSV